MLDTQMLTLDYFNSDEGFTENKRFAQSVDLRALTRSSRDLIALTIRCFSALSYFKHSKAISCVDTGVIEELKHQEASDFDMSEILAELEQVK